MCLSAVLFARQPPGCQKSCYSGMYTPSKVASTVSGFLRAEPVAANASNFFALTFWPMCFSHLLVATSKVIW